MLSVLAISSYYLIWQHLVCNFDNYCGLHPFLANDIAVFVSVLSTIVIYYIRWYRFHQLNIILPSFSSLFLIVFKAKEVYGFMQARVNVL